MFPFKLFEEDFGFCMHLAFVGFPFNCEGVLGEAGTEILTFGKVWVFAVVDNSW